MRAKSEPGRAGTHSPREDSMELRGATYTYLVRPSRRLAAMLRAPPPASAYSSPTVRPITTTYSQRAVS